LKKKTQWSTRSNK